MVKAAEDGAAQAYTEASSGASCSFQGTWGSDERFIRKLHVSIWSFSCPKLCICA